MMWAAAWRRGTITIGLLLVMCLLPFGAVQAAMESVDTITVHVVPEAGTVRPPALIAKRMAASVKTVGEHVLAGRNVADIAGSRAAYEKLIQEVFDRVLIGYIIQRVSIEPGRNSTITVEVAPWGDTVQDIAWEYDFGNLSPELVKLVQQDIGDLESKADTVLLGLPIDAVDWASMVSKSMIRDILAEQLPEFRTGIDIIPGRRTVVKLSLAPAGPTVLDTRVSLRSDSIPNLLLLQMRPAVEELSKQLTGLPVAFVERHNEYFTEKLEEVAIKRSIVQKYGLSVKPAIDAGKDTVINLQVETDRYHLWLEGYLDVGKEDNNTSAKLHAGKYLNKRNEAFLEVGFVPGTVSWEVSPGWGYTLAKGTTGGFKYDLTHSESYFWFKQQLTPVWGMRFEYNLQDESNELGIRYKLHDFVSLEYIFSENDRWLRLVGNL
ncbi:putative secreted protein [Propionispora sp. 2/2-37]|uniref:hypothetical protein n=1 Tax=Propionispora sp. 2/2-37 TaxID=1677858 RepID=UPI0006BFE0CE|nr:hypothetical protein [Propionispora sp. 2/2-37]CUH94545.1 putative secreted protein [Propionispora sp. 2/2-37]